MSRIVRKREEKGPVQVRPFGGGKRRRGRGGQEGEHDEGADKLFNSQLRKAVT